MTVAGDALATVAAGRPPELTAAAHRLTEIIEIIEIIEGSGHELDSAVKWGALTYALRGDFHHWICSVGVTKRTADLALHF